MTRIKGIIFDWAGTAVDYGCMAPVHVFLDIFRSIGIEPTMEEVREPMGRLKWDHIQAMLDMPRIGEAFRAATGRPHNDADVDRLHDQFEPKLLALLHRFADPLPGVLETVSLLRERGYKIGATTGYNDAMMAIVAKVAGQHGYAPDYWLTPDSVGGKGRPLPYMIFDNIIRLDMGLPHQVVKIGDTESDMQEARNAGVWSVGVVRGSSMLGLTGEEAEAMDPDALARRIAEAERRFLDSGAHFVVEEMAELPGAIDAIDRKLALGGHPGWN
ncbi:phosphonoacetaldehyde hydrolase [Paenibacillus lycopersici]|uniref:Phosphonoacetaldehyde hydrolase n=1 Tax=Paenibacillus lycopersici TaxID=2704462 RepID=A0A6C0G6Y6_9BACL|nr:phosphonoacetaldehyde hydrolase [Paenibacillus lycopersici]QHT62265.1 phosphonoacetaldehyde hydrolase [Paenibacillus lycopersici]